MNVPIGVKDARVSLAADAEYFNTAQRMLRGSWQRALCSLFIVDGDPERDSNLLVSSLLYELECCVWRGVDTRLLVGGSHGNLEIAQTAFTAIRLAHRYKVPSRWLTRQAKIRGSHIKMIVADDRVLIGSHNWSGGAFSNQIQDSVLVTSPALSARLSSFFDSQWSRARDNSHD